MGCIGSKSKDDGQLHLGHFRTLRVLGKGAFGKVHAVVLKQNNKFYAMKCLSKHEIIETGKVKSVLSEKILLSEINHEYVVNLRYAFQDESDLYMIVDLMVGGDLRFHLQRAKIFTEFQALFYVAQVAEGLKYLHSVRIVHRDIKPDNLLLDEFGNAHLTDFNVSVKLAYEYLQISKENNLHVNRKGKNHKGKAGTYPYMAPEIVAKERYDTRIDYWSLGICLFEFLTGHTPFRGRKSEELEQNILSKELSFPAEITSSVRDVIKGLLTRDPEKRFGYEELRNHSVFREFRIDWTEIEKKSAKSPFTPDKDRANCSAIFEIEDQFMVKKKYRKLDEEQQKQFDIWNHRATLKEDGKVLEDDEILEDSDSVAEDRKNVVRLESMVTVEDIMKRKEVKEEGEEDEKSEGESSGGVNRVFHESIDAESFLSDELEDKMNDLDNIIEDKGEEGSENEEIGAGIVILEGSDVESPQLSDMNESEEDASLSSISEDSM